MLSAIDKCPYLLFGRRRRWCVMGLLSGSGVRGGTVLVSYSTFKLSLEVRAWLKHRRNQ